MGVGWVALHKRQMQQVFFAKYGGFPASYLQNPPIFPISTQTEWWTFQPAMLFKSLPEGAVPETNPPEQIADPSSLFQPPFFQKKTTGSFRIF